MAVHDNAVPTQVDLLVNADGYEVGRLRDGTRVLLPRSGAAGSALIRTPAIELLLRFAELPIPLADVEWVGFANRFGDLRTPMTEGQPPASPVPMPASAWEPEITAVRGSLILSGALKRAEPGTVFRLADYGEFGKALQQWTPARPHSPAQWTAAVPDPANELDAPAIGQLLATFVEWHVVNWYMTKLMFDGTARSFRFSAAADDGLLPTIWHQLIRALEGTNTYLPCGDAACRRLLLVAPGHRTRRAAYCSATHRARAGAARHDRAIALHDSGVDAAVIAMAVGSSLDTVRRWIEKARQQPNKPRGASRPNYITGGGQ